MVVHSAETRKSDAKDLSARDAAVHDMLRVKSKCLAITSLIFNFVMLLMLFGAGYYLCRYSQEICEMRVQNDVERFEALGIGYEVKGCDVHVVESTDDANPVKDPITEFAEMGEKPAHQSPTPGRNKTLLRRRRPNQQPSSDRSDLDISYMGEQEHLPSNPRGLKTPPSRRPNGQRREDQSSLESADMAKQGHEPSTSGGQKTPLRRRRLNGKGKSEN